jgi:hypothetical protein
MSKLSKYINRVLIIGLVASQSVFCSTVGASDAIEGVQAQNTILLSDVHQIGDIANMEGDTTARQLQNEVNLAHSLIKGMSLDELKVNLDDVADKYQKAVIETFLCGLSHDKQQGLLTTFYSLEEIKKGLLLEHDLGWNLDEIRQVELYNGAAVLDRPFEEKVNLDTLTNQSEAQGVHLKETLLADYDDAIVNQAFLSVLAKSANKSHSMLGISAEKKLRITAQIHRGSSGVKQIQLLIQMMKELYGPRLQHCILIENEFECWYQLSFDNNVEVIFRNGYLEHTLKGYLGSGFVVSLGLVMGLSQEIPSGKIVVSDKFIPFDQKRLEIFECDKRQRNNRLADVVSMVLADDEQQSQVMKILASNPAFQSQNRTKKFKEQPLKAEDFAIGTTLLIINDIWNPVDGDEKKTVRRFQSKL